MAERQLWFDTSCGDALRPVALDYFKYRAGAVDRIVAELDVAAVERRWRDDLEVVVGWYLMMSRMVLSEMHPPRPGRPPRPDFLHLVHDLGVLYERATGCEPGGSANTATGGPFCRFVRLALREAGADPRRPLAARNILRNLAWAKVAPTPGPGQGVLPPNRARQFLSPG
jgi:hypothetical protein